MNEDIKRVARLLTKPKTKRKYIRRSASEYLVSKKYDHSEEYRKPIVERLIRYAVKDDNREYQNDLEYDWFYDNIFTKPCVYCGTTTELIGADRIDNSKGHTMDNVVPSCGLCNMTRADRFSHEEMFLLGETIKAIRESR